MKFEIYRGDLLPNLRVTLTQAHPDDIDLPADRQRRIPVDLTGATKVRVILVKPGVAVAFIDREVASRDANGVVVMEWQVADTAAVTRLLGEVEVTWPGSKPQTYRFGVVDVLPDYA